MLIVRLLLRWCPKLSGISHVFLDHLWPICTVVSLSPGLATSLLPLAIPGIVIAVGWLILAPRLGLFNTPWLILAAYVTSFTALVVQAVRAPLAGIPAAAEEAARISGAGPMRSLVDISCRMAVPAAVSGAAAC